MKQMMSQLTFSCMNKNCHDKKTLFTEKEYIDHVEECNGGLVKCPYEECDSVLSKAKMDDHLNNNC